MSARFSDSSSSLGARAPSHAPRKRFGQNFLNAPDVIEAIVAAIAPAREDALVEIGPGLGALTFPLLERVACLHVVEIDRDLAARLSRHDPERLKVHEGDALDFDFGRLARDVTRERKGVRERVLLRLAGNLPYNISTPLLFHLARFAGVIRDMHFMLQKEVVERMVAGPGSAAYGRLSVMLQYRFDLEWLLDVPPESFFPAPKVSSAVARLIPKPAEALAARDEVMFARLVADAFSQRRKMLRNALKAWFSDQDWARVGVDPEVRAETLAAEEFVRLANDAAERGARR
ncbi:MAG: 16S rRNA (adenine(1518)-N(6)/adenine(1519)-N(6))-dimethyltransferase RsmA [Zoogloeaceae bacterium]|jgi:16S rRNA (adenine1518-N6/adenine1519-N6)-dimethyltransferase|nr:16S rRNA (adenine(1518)-N(6)/adenine(1519)-N(6))-dimethyltransferase RsmA [Zoogloeaceae bacterium]